MGCSSQPGAQPGGESRCLSSCADLVCGLNEEDCNKLRRDCFPKRGKPVLKGNRMLRDRILRVSLDFLDLKCMPESMLAQHDQPLITVEIPKRDVRKEVIA